MTANDSRTRRLWRGLARLHAAWSDDRCARRAAAVSYYTTFSLAPILVIVLAVAGMIVDTTTLTGAILHEARILIGEPGAALLGELRAKTGGVGAGPRPRRLRSYSSAPPPRSPS